MNQEIWLKMRFQNHFNEINIYHGSKMDFNDK